MVFMMIIALTDIDIIDGDDNNHTVIIVANMIAIIKLLISVTLVTVMVMIMGII